MDLSHHLENQQEASGSTNFTEKQDSPEASDDEPNDTRDPIVGYQDLNLCEHAPMTYILKHVPKQGQKRFKTFDIKLMCVAALKEYIALGSNVGIVYLFDRKEQELIRLRSEGYIGPITCVRMCKSVDYMVAAGTKDGRIFCHQIPRMFKEKQWESTVIRGIHKESITCLEWSQNAEKIFSGDADGVVVCTIIQYGEKIDTSSQILLQENYPIVQLSYSYRKLLIASSFRSVIYNPSNNNSAQQIGQRNRKDLGKYGITFFPLRSPMYEYTLFTSRPNFRLWKCNSSGEVLETVILKDQIQDSPSTIPLLQPFEQPQLQRKQASFGLLEVFVEKYLISWNEMSLIIIDPGRKAIARACWGLNNAVDLSICEDEIFILEENSHLIRLATEPEVIKKLPDDEEDQVLKAIVKPFKQLETGWKHLNIFEKDTSVKSENEINLFSWLKRSSDNTSVPSEAPKESEDQIMLSQLRNDPSFDNKTNSTENNSHLVDNLEISSSVLGKETNESEFMPPDAKEQPNNLKVDFSHIKIEDETDAVVCVKSKKAKKKHKPKKGTKETMSSSVTSLEQGVIESQRKDESILTTSCPEEYFNKEDESRLCSSTVTENNSNDVTASEETSVVESENTTTEVKENNSSFGSLCSPKSNVQLEADMETLLDSILSQYKAKDDTKLESDDTIDSSQIVETNNVHSVGPEYVVAEDIKKTKLNKLKLGMQVSNQSIQSPEYNVYARSSSIMDGNLESTGNSNLAMKENILNSDNGENSDDCDEQSSDGTNIRTLMFPDVWARDRFPSVIVSLTVCSKFICCLDNKNVVHYSDLSHGPSWEIIAEDVNQIAASPTGRIIWKLCKGTAYAGLFSEKTSIHRIVWVKVASDVKYISVDEDYAWYIKTNGELHTQQNMFSNASQNVSKAVIPPHPVILVACSGNVVCVLTSKGKLFCRTGITEYRPEGLSWQELKLGQRVAVNLTIAANVVWIVDNSCNIWFQHDISGVLNSKRELCRWWKVDVSELLFEDSHRSLQRMNAVAASVLSPVVVLPTNLAFLSGGHKPCIGACEKGVWYCEALGRYLFSNKREIIGHHWRKVILKATSASFSWKFISASGMLTEKGVFWGMLSNDDFLCFTGLKLPPTFIHPPNTRSKICCITAAPEALWILTLSGEIYVRNGISSLHPEGTSWVKLNISQLSNRLVHISCGEDTVWGCDCNGTVFLRVGSLKAPAERSLHQAWADIDASILGLQNHNQHSLSDGSKTQIHITKVYTGQKYHMLWALDKKNNIYVREGIFPDLPIGTGWVYVKGIQAKELCTGGTYVWAVTLNDEIYCRYGISEKNYIGDYWKKFPGNVTSLSATLDCRLWAIGHDQILYEHKMHVLHHWEESNVKEAAKKQEDDWELL